LDQLTKEIVVETENKAVAPRTPLNIDVDFRKSYAREETKANLKNISLSGAFLFHSGEKLAAGEKVQLTFSVSGRERDVQAIVVWTNTKGSGVKFLPLNNRDTQIIDDLIYYVESKRSGTRTVLDQIFKKVG
jgi:hypothetical protein